MLEHPAGPPWRRCRGSDAAAATARRRYAMAPWHHGTTPWRHDAMVPWRHGATAPWYHHGSQAAAALGPGSCAANKNPCYVLA